MEVQALQQSKPLTKHKILVVFARVRNFQNGAETAQEDNGMYAIRTLFALALMTGLFSQPALAHESEIFTASTGQQFVLVPEGITALRPGERHSLVSPTCDSHNSSWLYETTTCPGGLQVIASQAALAEIAVGSRDRQSIRGDTFAPLVAAVAFGLAFLLGQLRTMVRARASSIRLAVYSLQTLPIAAAFVFAVISAVYVGGILPTSLSVVAAVIAFVCFVKHAPNLQGRPTWKYLLAFEVPLATAFYLAV